MTEYIKREDVILAITRNHDEVLSVADAIEAPTIIEAEEGET